METRHILEIIYIVGVIVSFFIIKEFLYVWLNDKGNQLLAVIALWLSCLSWVSGIPFLILLLIQKKKKHPIGISSRGIATKIERDENGNDIIKEMKITGYDTIGG